MEASTALKAGTFLILTTLILGNTTALNWETPSGDQIADPFTANVSDLDGSVQEVNFTLIGNSQDYNQSRPATIEDSSASANTEFDIGDGGEGDYTLTVNTWDGSEVTSNEKEIVVDSAAPTVEKADDKEFVGEDDEISFDVSDGFTDVTEFSVEDSNSDSDVLDETVDDDPVCPAGETGDDACTYSFNLDTGSVDPAETITINYVATDDVGNTADDSFTYEFDESYDASAPEFSVQDADDDNNVRMDSSDEEKDITVTVDDEEEDEVSEIRVTCYDGSGDQIDQTGFEDVDSNDYEFTCELDGEDYAGSSEDIYVEACDEAGNCESSDERTYSFDYLSPVVDGFETVQSYSVFNSDFDVSYEVSDEASGIEDVEYMLSPTILPGNGNSVDFDENEGEFTVDTSELSRGEHTVYFRVKDGVDRWSDVATVDFEFYPNELPELSLSTAENLNVTAGSSETLEVEVENTGELFIPSANVSVSGSTFADETQELSNMAPDDTIPVDFRLAPNSSEVGTHTLSVEVSEPPTSSQVEVLVETNSEQEDEVESKVSNFTSQLEALENNISDLRNSGLSSDLNSTLSDNVSDFVTSVRNAESYVEQGQHYKAMNELEGVSEKYELAQQSYSNVKEEHELNKRNMMFKTIFGLVVLVSIGGAVLVGRREDYNIDMSEYQIPDLGAIDLNMDLDISEKVDSVKEFIKEEEEEVEEGFEGFR